MIKKTAIAAAAVATAIAATPVSTAAAGSFGFHFNTPHGSFHFGNGGHGYHPAPQPHAMSCWQAGNYLQTQFAHVWKIECNGKIYTFKVKNGWGHTKIVKINKWNGNYWFA